MRVFPIARTIRAVAVGASMVAAAQAQACASDPYIGTICVVTYTRGCPSGFLPADGRSLSITSNQALYSLIGVVFGGDGRTTFNLPDLRGRTPVGVGGATNVPGRNPTSQVNLGQYRGAENVTLSAAQMAPHTHTATFAGTGGGTPGQASGQVSIPVTSTASSLPVSVSGSLMIANAAGGGQTTPANNAILTRGGAQANIYATSGAADTSIGPTQTFTGTASGNISGTATGTVTLPVTGGGGITGGTVTVNPNTGGSPVNIVPAQLGLHHCIAVQGLYPSFD